MRVPGVIVFRAPPPGPALKIDGRVRTAGARRRVALWSRPMRRAGRSAPRPCA